MSFTVDKKCSSTNVSHTLASVKLMSANQTAVNNVSADLVNCTDVKDTVNAATCQHLPSSSAVLLSSQTSDAASFIDPLPVTRQHQTKTSIAASSCVFSQTAVQPASYSHLAQPGQSLLEVQCSSLHPILPNQTLPLKVIFQYLFLYSPVQYYPFNHCIDSIAFHN